MSSTAEKKIKEIISTIFDIDEKAIDDSFSRNTYNEWDSLKHLMLVNELENQFNKKLTFEQVLQIVSYRDIVNIFEQN